MLHRETSGDGTPNSGAGVTAETKSVSVMRGGGKGTRGEPFALNLPKRAARADPPRRSGRMTGPRFLRLGAGSGQLAPGPNRPKRGERLLQPAGTGPFGHMAGAPPPPKKTPLLTSKVRGLGGKDRRETPLFHSGQDGSRAGGEPRAPPYQVRVHAIGLGVKTSRERAWLDTIKARPKKTVLHRAKRAKSVRGLSN